MNEITLARKYARALFETSVSDGREDIVYNELRYVFSCIESDVLLKKIWFDRRISKTDKKSIMNKILEDKVTKLCISFIELIINKKRENIFSYMLDNYYKFLMESKNTIEAEVNSAFELEEKEVKMIRDKLLSITGAKEINLSFNVDRSLIGGLFVRVKDEIYDGTILNKLKNLRELVMQ